MSEFVKIWADGVFGIEDGTATTPLSLEQEFSNGDFQVDGLAAVMRELLPLYSRAKLRGLRYGNPEHPTGSFSGMMRRWANGTNGTFLDFVLGTGPYTARVSTTADIGDVDTFTLTWSVKHRAGNTYKLKLPDCHLKIGLAEGSPNSIKFSFTCYADPDDGDWAAAWAEYLTETIATS